MRRMYAYLLKGRFLDREIVDGFVKEKPLYEDAEYHNAVFVGRDEQGVLDVMRNYGTIAKECYGYNVSVIDLRNPTRSNGNNLLNLVNKYMDLFKENPRELVYKAKAEKYAKIISKTIILSGMDAASLGQNAYFYDAAEGLLTEILSVADIMGGKLKNRCVFFCDEYGTLPKIESAGMMFSASRSRRLQIVPVIQSFAQLEKNYGKEGAEIIIDNTQLTIFGGFAPN